MSLEPPRDLGFARVDLDRVRRCVKLVVFVAILAYVGNLARRGLLPRTRPIVPGELAVSD